MPDSTIDRIGKYEIQAELGEGAFGRVYRAYDPTVNRPVAIKILTAEGKDLITRFRTEASAAGNLRHKNIVTIYEFGEHKGRPFIAMELLEGEDLSQVIAKREPLTLLQKMRIMSQAAEGLHCAHANGIFHRDVKPANIKLLPDGTVKILDFGIARVTRDRDATRLTQKGDLLGTILYMAPEQFSAAEVDRLCDIFAYGAIYYELLSGTHPFASSDPRNAMFKITFEDPEPLHQLVPEIPESLEQIVSRALQKDRELRYQTLRDLLIDSKPILLELERERANSLLVAAKDLFARGELEAAEAKAIEIIDLDLGIREAYEIREAAQKQLQVKIVQPRIEALLHAAEEDIARKRFADAVLNYEAALRLDRTNAGIRQQLENARNLLERGRKVSRLALEARVALESGNLEEASEKVASALALDPEHGEIQRVRAQVDQLARARRRAQEIAAAKDLLAGRGFHDAQIALAELARQFPEDGEIVSLQDAAAAGIRAEAVANVSARARDLSGRFEFDEAVRALEAALRQYAGDPELTNELEEVVSGRERHERERSITAALATAQAERASGRRPAAISALDAALRQWPGEQRLVALRAELQAEADAQRRAEEVEQIRGASTESIQAGRHADAMRQLAEALKRFPDETELRELFVVAEAGHRRSVRVGKAAASARQSLSIGDFDRAVQALEAGLEVDPGSAELEQLLANARAGREARIAKAIEDAVARCLRLREDGSLTEALSVAREALGTYPGEQRLLTLRDDMQRELDAARKRRARSDSMAAEARAAEGAGDYDGALDLWTQVGKMCPEFPNLDAEAQRVAGTIAKLRRERMLREIEAAIEANEIGRAADLLQEAEYDFTDPAAAEFGALRKRVDAIASANRLLDEGRQAFAGRQYKDTARRFREAAQRVSSDSRRVKDVAGELAELGSAIVGSDWRAGQRILEAASKIDASSPGVKALVERVEQRRRTEAVAEAVDRSREFENSGDLAAAERAVGAALASYPGEDLLAQRQRELRDAIQQREKAVAEAVDRSRVLEKSGDLAAAETVVGAALASYPGEDLLAQRQRELRDAIQQHEKAVAEAVDRSRALEQTGDLAAAETVVGAALASYPGEDVLAQRQRDLRDAIQQRENAVAEAVDRSRALEQTGDLAAAETGVAAALASYPGEELLAQRQRELRDAIQQREKAVAEAVDRSRALEQTGDLTAAETVVVAALASYPGEELLTHRQRELGETIQQREKAVAEAVDRSRVLEKSGDLAAAETVVVAALASYAGEDVLAQRQQELRDAIQKREKAVAEAVDRSRVLEQTGDLAGAETVVGAALASYPGEDLLAQRQGELRDAIQQREKAVAEAVDRSRVLEESGDLAAAEIVLRTALASYAGEETLLQRERELRVAIQERQQREKAVSEAIDHSRALEKSGDLAAAERAAAAALGSHPGEKALLERQQELRVAIQAQQQREKAVAEAVDRSRVLEDSGDLVAAERAVVAALASCPGEDVLVQRQQELRVSIQARQQREKAISDAVNRSHELEKSGDLVAAERAVVAALASYPGEDVLVQRQQELRVAVRQRREQTIADAVNRSRTLENSGDFDGAEKTLDAALAAHPGTDQILARLHELRTNRRRREDTLRAIEALDSDAKTADTNRLREIGNQLDLISKQSAGHLDEIRSRASAVKQAVEGRIAELTRPKPAPIPAQAVAEPPAEPQKSSGQVATAEARQIAPQPARAAPRLQRNRITIAGAAAAVIALGLIGWRAIRPTVGGTGLSILSDLRGAEVTIGDRKCVIPECVLNLRPGTYTLTARKDGYKPISQSLTVAPGRHDIKFPLALEPLPQLLQVNTNFASGTVYIDGRLAGQLQEGQFTTSGIAPGSHTLGVTGGGSEFQAEFRSAAGEAPQLVTPITAKDLAATVIANAGSAGALACNCDARPITIDGAPVGQTSPNAATQLKGLAEGARRIDIEGRSLVADIRANPTVSVFLATDRNVGMLVVETGQDNARVLVDNRPYPRLTEHGIARIQVPVGEHSLRAEREGYRSPGAQRIHVAKNEEKQISLPLTPIPPVLELANALPGAEVKLDGRVVGQVNAAGGFRTEVSPGNHRIELTKGGYTAVQLSGQFAPGKLVRPRPSEISMNQIAAASNPAQADRTQVETQDWERLRNTANTTDVEAYLHNHPDGAHTEDAKSLLARLRQQEQQAAQENAARMADQSAWAATDKSRKAALQDYVSRFAGGAHAQEARNLIAQIDKREADSAAIAAQGAKEAGARAEAQKVALDREGVMQALRAYAEAFAKRDVNALKAIWPQAPDSLGKAIRESRITSTLKPLGDAAISGDSATLVCIRSNVQEYPGQMSSSKQTQVTVVLGRRGDSWIIRDIVE